MNMISTLNSEQPNVDRMFEGENLDLTGRAWLYCTFINGTLTAHRTDGRLVEVRAGYLENCTFLGDGWPEHIGVGVEAGGKPAAREQMRVGVANRVGWR